MSASAISIGPFTLQNTLGQGGMGIVYRAEHRKTRLPVALKFLSAYERDGPLRAAFRREVQLVARLDHPGVVRVLDYGAVAADEVQPDAPFAAGDPWLAMELARHGSLSEITIESWEELRWVLLSVLDALAHAHARGVIHRDLKPGNMLIAEEAGQRVLRLADFGIAHLRRELAVDTDLQASSSEHAGTPHYMAPEQIRAEWREFGPWTDLYALGCVAYRLATNMHVFRGDSPFLVLDQHIRSAPPPIRSRMALPTGFEAWVHRLLAKNPRDRFRRAADAAWILRNLPAPSGLVVHATMPEIVALGGTMTMHHLGLVPAEFSIVLGATMTAQSQTQPLEELLSAAPAAVGGHVELVAPMSDNWRTTAAPTAAAAYFDVGLGLFGMRAIPMFGRERERDELWRILGQVRDRRRSQVITLEGGPGSGKSALAQWLCERAHEVAGASVVRVAHTAEPTPTSGFAAAIERFTSIDGLDRQGAWSRLRELMAGRCHDPALRAAALIQLLRPSDGINDGVPPVVLANATERSIALRDGLAAMIGPRPLVVWLDDAHHPSAAESVEAVSSFVRADSDLAAMVIYTCRTDHNANSEAVDKLEPEHLELEPVTRGEIEQLVRAMLPVSERAAIAVAERAEGVPLFAAQILTDWVQSGRLVARDRGFEVDDAAIGGLPADISELWRERVRRVVARQPDSAAFEAMLRTAAVLGRDVDRHELAAVEAQLQLPHVVGFEDTLIRSGLAVTSRRGFSFVHAMLADSIAADASEDARRRIHAACAQVVAASAEPKLRELRIARHSFFAGRFEDAIDNALQSIAASWSDDRAARLGGALSIADESIAALGLPATDRRAVRAGLWRTRGFRVRWDFGEVKARARDLVVAAASDELSMERAEALVELGLAEGYADGRLELALPQFQAAATIFERLSATKALAEVLSRLTYVHSHMKNGEAGIETGRRSVELYRQVGDADGIARGLIALAQAMNVAGADGVVEVFEEAARVSEKAGLRYWQANVLYGLATIDEQAGRHEQAIDRLRQSARICADIGSTAIDACRINLACLLILRGDWDEPTSMLREIEQRGTLAVLWRRARYGLLAVAAHAGDTVRVAELRREIEAEPVEDDTTLALVELADAGG